MRSINVNGCLSGKITKNECKTWFKLMSKTNEIKILKLVIYDISMLIRTH